MSANDFFARAETGGAFAASGPMSALLAENWWAIALRGVAAILFGIIALLMPGITIEAFVLLFAAYMLVDGIFAIVAGVRAARHRERWGALMLQGILDLIAAAIAIFVPIATTSPSSISTPPGRSSPACSCSPTSACVNAGTNR